MDSLNCLNKESIILLVNNNLFKPLIIGELLKSKLSEVNLPEDKKKSLLDSFLNSERIKDDQSLDTWLAKRNLTKENFLSNFFNSYKKQQLYYVCIIELVGS